jgi:predicted RNA-binding Zn ribbon-like protein
VANGGYVTTDDYGVSNECSPVESYELIGGELCLDFSNTASRRTVPEGPAEKLRQFGDVVTWAERVGILASEGATLVRDEAVRRRADAALVLERARALREAIYRIFSALGRSESPALEDVALLDEEYHRGMARRRLTADGWVWAREGDALEWALGPVSFSAAELLTSDRLNRVKECTNHACTWLFLDVSKNRSRRWCDMKDCGNRAKARRHYAKTQSRR